MANRSTSAGSSSTEGAAGASDPTASGRSLEGAITRIRVRIRIGGDRMAASDDPLFLGLRGQAGREFRLDLPRTRTLRRNSEDVFVLAAPADPEVSVAHPELNDPTAPVLDAASITGVYLRKGLDPVPNVRGVGEMDDRLAIEEAEVTLEGPALPRPLRFARRGPIWLGLICGLSIELAAAHGPGTTPGGAEGGAP